jgi:hypothetical protein
MALSRRYRPIFYAILCLIIIAATMTLFFVARTQKERHKALRTTSANAFENYEPAFTSELSTSIPLKQSTPITATFGDVFPGLIQNSSISNYITFKDLPNITNAVIVGTVTAQTVTTTTATSTSKASKKKASKKGTVASPTTFSYDAVFPAIPVTTHVVSTQPPSSNRLPSLAPVQKVHVPTVPTYVSIPDLPIIKATQAPVSVAAIGDVIFPYQLTNKVTGKSKKTTMNPPALPEIAPQMVYLPLPPLAPTKPPVAAPVPHSSSCVLVAVPNGKDQ